ncbi:hypothetical protein H1R82_07345 [Thermoactinomyces intermedius]|jgi:hypothetical protein|uniref:Uncharacterized protein n=2 Tax=Thermoactinomyces TaxID=2023 RepID=A0A8I1DB78_THEIN|nr:MULTISPECIES: hypothetical protein [Thermoactinomyces]MBA4547683.1 hypothetical protein [Thermoactinomyces intermedius]MBA4552561.1 hypothetical protein [Thermoactinomyces vulgaris]MBA4836443.1 hypothetical protein [Thermoactinomyces intermedius]MBH8589707.1 hypothetical protein [Thermoactinomyces vulgaris]MBH8594088.1 hypothetical protein [Thermoactinomyces intermedius]
MAKQTVTVKLDKQRKLKYTFSAFCELEEALGRPLTEIKNNFRMKDLRALVWAGLLHENPDLTLEETGRLLDEAPSLEDVGDAVAKALEMSVTKNAGNGGSGK